MKNITKIKNAIKRKVNESRLRSKVSSILEDALPNILSELDQLDQAFLDAKPVKKEEDLDELDVRKTHGDRRIENPKTGNQIKLRTALKAKKGTAVYQQARQIYNQLKDKPANEQITAQLKELKELLDMNERAYASTDGKPYFDYDPGQGKLKEAKRIKPHDLGYRMNLRRARAEFNRGENIAAVSKSGKGTFKIDNVGDFPKYPPRDWDYAFIVKEGKINEISTKAGLDDVIKGRTNSIEGIKMSKSMAQGMKDWIAMSPYGRKYGKHINKGRIASVIDVANSFGVDRYLDNKGKKEWKAIHDKHSPRKAAKRAETGKTSKSTETGQVRNPNPKGKKKMVSKAYADQFKKRNESKINEDHFKKGQKVKYQLDRGSNKALRPSTGTISNIKKMGNYYQYTIQDGGPVPVWGAEIIGLAETKSAPPGHYFTKGGNVVKGRLTKAARAKGATKSDPKDKQRSKVPPATQRNESAKDKFGVPPMNKWWTGDKDALMSAIYHAQRQLPPTDKAKYEKNWKSIVKQLQRKYPAPTAIYRKRLNEDYSQRARNFRVALRRRLEAMKKGKKIKYGKLAWTALGNGNFKDSRGRTVPYQDIVQDLKFAVQPDIMQHRGARGDDMVDAYLKFEGYMGNPGDVVKVSHLSGKGERALYILQKADGRAMIDMTFSSPEEAKKYAAKRRLKLKESKLTEAHPLNKVIGGRPYSYIGGPRKGKYVLSGPMNDREKEAIIRGAKKAGYRAKPNMGGGVNIFIEGKLTEAKFYVTYNKGRGQGKRVVTSKESDYEDPRVFRNYNDAEKYVKMAKSGGSMAGQITAYWVSDINMNRIDKSGRRI